jgi:hypothetical protein
MSFSRVANPVYRTRHSRVTKARGRATQYLCSGCCGSQAREWATVHGRDGLDVFADYVPLCFSCHRWYDAPYARRARGSAAGLAILTEAQVTEIKAALRAGQTVASIAKAYGRAWPTIDGIKTGRTWRHVS